LNEQGWIARSGDLSHLLDQPGPARASRALKDNHFLAAAPVCAGAGAGA